jgi:glucuronoarabinoxylan endo-1,4-beta-xylanase
MKWIRILGLLLTLAICQRVQAQTATVNWTTTYQTMDGWGGDTEFLSDSNAPRGQGGFVLTPSQVAMFYSTTTGIGLEYIVATDTSCPTTGACTVAASTDHSLPTLQKAVAYGASVQLNLFPPANFMYSGTFKEGTAGSNGSCVSNWSGLAAFTVQWIQMLNANGVPVSVLEPMNEPELPANNSVCVWSAEAIHSYIAGTLGPALAAATWSGPQVGPPTIAISQNSAWFDTDLVSSCLDDPTCAQYVSIASGHGYGVGGVDGTDNGYCCHTATAPPSSTNGKHIWMPELNGGSNYNSSAANWAFDPSMSDALVWAHNIHDYLTVANASAWFYWELVDWCGGATDGGCEGAPFNSGLAVSSGGGETPSGLITSARMSVVGNWSKFVRTGWVRIGATANPAAGVFVTAFNQTSSGGFAIVAINNNNSNTAVTFSLSGFPRSPSSVTPWTTSSTLNLAQQSAVSVSDASYTYTLPASSVTSFVGNTATSPVPPTPPAPPTQLMESVQ